MSVVPQFQPKERRRTSRRPPTSCRWLLNFSLKAAHLSETTDFMSVVLQFQPNQTSRKVRSKLKYHRPEVRALKNWAREIRLKVKYHRHESRWSLRLNLLR